MSNILYCLGIIKKVSVALAVKEDALEVFRISFPVKEDRKSSLRKTS
jgi:hypothetical protein